MLMQHWDPQTGPGTVILLLVLVAGCGIGRVLIRTAVGWVESSLDIPHRDARETVLLLMPIGVGVIILLSWLLNCGLVSVALPMTFSVGLVPQVGVFSWRHSVSLRRALPFSLVIAVIPFVVVATVWGTVLVAGKVLMPYWGTLGVDGIE